VLLLPRKGAVRLRSPVPLGSGTSSKANGVSVRESDGLLVADWNSLEVAKLLVAALTPILLFVLGLIVSRAAHRVEDAQWANRNVIGQRLELFEEMAPKLNDLYCFFLLIGHFREVRPPEALALKRELDRTFYANAPLFSSEFGEAYRDFMHTCFETFTGLGEDAKLRANARLQWFERTGRDHARGGGVWSDSWKEMFSEDPAEREVVAGAYERLMDEFARDVGVQHPQPDAHSRRLRFLGRRKVRA
jgi:hypothetical protein